MNLPYAPFPGLIIHDGKGDSFEITLVKYDKNENLTSCFIEHDYHESYEYAKQDAKKWGWKLREVPPGTICKNIRGLFC
jgi:hypothetical protein